MKQFNICVPGTNDVVMGPMGPGNVYLTAYPVIENQRKIAELEIGEHVQVTYNLSGQKGTYWIVQIEDAS